MDQLVYSYLYSIVTARRPLSGQVTAPPERQCTAKSLLIKKEEGMQF